MLINCIWHSFRVCQIPMKWVNSLECDHIPWYLAAEFKVNVGRIWNVLLAPCRDTFHACITSQEDWKEFWQFQSPSRRIGWNWFSISNDLAVMTIPLLLCLIEVSMEWKLDSLLVLKWSRHLNEDQMVEQRLHTLCLCVCVERKIKIRLATELMRCRRDEAFRLRRHAHTWFTRRFQFLLPSVL